MKTINKLFNLMLLALLIISTSCTEEVEVQGKTKYLPGLESSFKTPDNVVNDIMQFNGFNGQRNNSLLNFSDATTSKYEGYEGLQLILVPKTGKDGEFVLYTSKKGELVNFVQDVAITDNSLTLINPAGESYYKFENNIVVDTEITVYDNDSNARKLLECDNYAEGYLDCLNAAQEQLADAVGWYATLAIEVGCGLWAPCAISVAVACTAMVAAGCPA